MTITNSASQLETGYFPIEFGTTNIKVNSKDASAAVADDNRSHYFPAD